MFGSQDVRRAFLVCAKEYITTHVKIYRNFENKDVLSRTYTVKNS